MRGGVDNHLSNQEEPNHGDHHNLEKIFQISPNIITLFIDWRIKCMGEE